MPFNPNDIDLPVKEIIPEVLESLKAENTLIINAPAGAGKSTLLPLAFLNEPWFEGKKILMLEPRRLAAKAIASRMAYFLGEEVGETIGYRIRFENRTSDKTRIEVLTEGILTRMLHHDNELKDVAMVIFDEFHERSIHADVALALCRESQQVLRQDLKIMIMSATLDMPQLTSLLGCKAVTSDGKLFPVDVFYEGDTDEFSMALQCAKVVKKAVAKHDGDALVFLPGQGEIMRTQEMLQKELRDFAIMPLYGALPLNRQHAAIFPHKSGKRKVVLATSIAETSLTIEGIKIVVDSGFGRTSKFDPKSGLSRLTTIQISKDSADQRTGRAGRLSPGVCYRMWSQATHSRLTDHIVPEILETDLASLMLDMAMWGVIDISQLTWLTQPPRGAVAQASQTLHDLNALENGRITPHGEKMLRLPCHPRIAHLLLMADEQDAVPLAADIAAFLEERDPLGKEAGIDINTRIEALRRYRRENNSGGRMQKIKKVADSYLQLFEVEEDNGDVDPYETGVLLTHAYPERIAHARPGNNAQFKLANGKIVAAGHRDDLAHEAWLAVAHMDARDGLGKIFMASPLNPTDLASLVKEQETIKWDTEDGGLSATLDLRIGNIILQSKPLPDPDEEHLLKAVSEAIKTEGEQLLNFDDDVTQWQNRVLSLRKWRPQEGWPDVSTPTLLITNSEWLSPYLVNIKKPAQLKKINLAEVLKNHLEYDKQQALDRLAPDKLKVPSGSKIQLNYRPDGLPPVLAVRIQEVFGMAETPKINEGRTSVLMHLLSPGFKPVQVTSDLKSFWADTYFEVKKELKRRYPKHVWPDDPTKEQAVRGVKRKN
ncbi:MAG: ATP-dependent helicase HrpB [Cyclobacteriaceae bacterium]